MALLNQTKRDIDLIDPNPWQTRQAEDPQHVEELAQSILKDGLMQVPSGRNSEGDRCQLAFGHSRLAAFKLLVALGRDEYREFPINIHPFSDENMAIAAFSENDKRKNLNPVERARAIEKMIADFGWTQQEVAERLQIDRSSISNSLRMLRMPAQVLIAVAADVIPVRSAMALLPYYELTPLELNALEEHFPESADSVSLFRSGMINSDAIRKTISIWMDYLHPNVEQIALPEQNDQPVFVESASEVQATDLPEETPQESNESEIAPIDFDGEPVDDNSNLNEPVNNQTEESLVFSPSGPPEGETPAAYGQRMSRVAGELIKSGKLLKIWSR